ncbi:MAG: efflux RND transporter periplasmic adaptor subunit, partial [Cyanobacteria bacterium P01_D01_bin.56]
PQAVTVLTKLVEPGDYVQPGTPIFELGNLSSLIIGVQVSELDIGQLSLGQPATVSFDAFPDIEAEGRITRISPVADTTSRLIPVEVTLSNPDQRIGSGKLARVQFSTTDNPTVVVPASALKTGSNDNTVFVIDKDETEPTVTARAVTIGQQNQGKIEILSGLEPNETFIVASDRPLATDQTVRLSILSELDAAEDQPE